MVMEILSSLEGTHALRTKRLTGSFSIKNLAKAASPQPSVV